MPTARLPQHISNMPTIDRHTFREDVPMDRRRATALSCRVASPRAPLHLPRQVVRDSASALNDGPQVVSQEDCQSCTGVREIVSRRCN